jgi:hypothetical protein
MKKIRAPQVKKGVRGQGLKIKRNFYGRCSAILSGLGGLAKGGGVGPNF